MQFNILGAALSHPSDLESRLSLPQFRKASRQMIFATASVEKCISPLMQLFTLNKKRFGLVYASAAGEIETSVDFLQNLFKNNVARPLLFQNSLHNATTGFIAIHFGITGPSLTVSHGQYPGEHALQAAELLLSARACDYCIVASAETFPRQTSIEWDLPEEGAACIVLSHMPESFAYARGVYKPAPLHYSAHRANENAWPFTAISENAIARLAHTVLKNVETPHSQWTSLL